jgi:DNA-binding NtrC family response regulator
MPKRQYKIFLVDDDTKHLILLKDHLEKHSEYDLKINIFSSGENCLDKLDENPDLIILDYYLDAIKPDAANGLAILKKIKDHSPGLPVVMMSSQDNVQVAMDIIRSGSYDYIIKNETAFLHARVIVDHVLESINVERYRKNQKLRETVLVLIILALAGGLVAMALRSGGAI